jgi:hypothetical protein
MGATYMKNKIEIINFLSEKFNYKKYLEIGLREPSDCFNHIKFESKDSVDPGLEANNNQAKYKYTSDSFFLMIDHGLLDKPLDYKWDLIFIDGLHISDQVERDINNALNHLSENGSIVLHDCNPPTEHHARAYYNDLSTTARSAWNGSVWKAIYKMRCTRYDLDICVVDKDWGCGVIRRGKQTIRQFNNPYFDYDKFDKNRVKDLNIISNLELPKWVEKPFYK